MTCDDVFDALAAGENDATKKHEIDAHLAGCEECRRCQEALAVYDEALEHPGRGDKDPPHVRDAILKAAHAKADEFARERRDDERPTIRGLKAAPARLRGPPRFALLAASVVALIAGSFLLGKLSKREEPRPPWKNEDSLKSSTAPVDTRR